MQQKLGDNLSSKNSVFETPSGAREELLPAITSVFGHEMVSRSLWIADCVTGGYVIRSPDGTKYFANYLRSSNGFDIHNVTKIEDVFGNYITVEYGGAGNASAGNGRVEAPYSLSDSNATGERNLIKEVKNYSRSNSLLNKVEFMYRDVNSVHFRVEKIHVNDSTYVTYSYAPVSAAQTDFNPYYFLNKVTIENNKSEDSVWEYKYYTSATNGLYSLEWYETPGNARISFVYKRENFRVTAGVEWPTIVVDSRTVGTNGGVQKSGSWTYTYDQNSSRDQTSIALPNGEKTIYEHVGADNYSSTQIWKVGTLLNKKYVSSTGSTMREEKYTYDQGINLSTQNDFHLYKATSGNNDHYTAQLTSLAITQDGTTYTTTYGSFDSLGNPKTITEVGNANKTTTLTYYNHLANWIIGKTEDVTVASSDGADGGKIDRAYKSDGLGLLDYESRFGAKTTYSYYTNGDINTIDGPRIDVTDTVTLSNYRFGIPRKEVHPEGVTISRTVDSKKGDITTATDGRGRVVTYGYDLDHSLQSVATSRTDDSDISVKLSYSSGGVTKTITRGSYTKVSKLDGLGRTIEETESGSGVTSTVKKMAYNALGQLSTESDPYYSGATPKGRSFSYDVLGRAKTITFTADNSKIEYDYLSGNKVKAKKYAGSTLKNEETSTYRSFGNPSEAHLVGLSQNTGSEIIVTTYERDKFGNITGISQGGKKRTYVRDSYKNIDYILNPETGKTDLSFDPAGNIKSKKVGASGLTTYIYDANNRLKSINYPGNTPDVEYSYYLDGTLNTVSTSGSPGSLWTYDYDANRNKLYETLSIGSNNFRFDYSYNALDAQRTISYPSVQGSRLSVDYAPDVFGRPTKVGSWVASGISYHANGSIHKYTYANGQQFTQTLDSRLMPDRLQSVKNGLYALDLDYAFNGVGNVTSIKGISQPNALSLDYDFANRLTHVNGALAFSYDVRGNIATRTLSGRTINFHYDTAKDTLNSVSGAVNWGFQYDTYGNTTANGTHNFTYDDANQLTNVNGSAASYAYDGHGRRSKEVVANRTRYTIYGSNNKLLFEYEPGVSKQEYVYLGSNLVIRRDTCSDTDSDGDKIPDCYELKAGLNPTSAADGLLDADGDGISNTNEYVASKGLGHALDDADGDGVSDKDEIAAGTNPLVRNAGGTNGDGVTEDDPYPLLTEFGCNSLPVGRTCYDHFALNEPTLSNSGYFKLHDSEGVIALNEKCCNNGTFTYHGSPNIVNPESYRIDFAQQSLVFDSQGRSIHTINKGVVQLPSSHPTTNKYRQSTQIFWIRTPSTFASLSSNNDPTQIAKAGVAHQFSIDTSGSLLLRLEPNGVESTPNKVIPSILLISSKKLSRDTSYMIGFIYNQFVKDSKLYVAISVYVDGKLFAGATASSSGVTLNDFVMRYPNHESGIASRINEATINTATRLYGGVFSTFGAPGYHYSNISFHDRALTGNQIVNMYQSAKYGICMEEDTDGDKIPDCHELKIGFDPYDAADGEADSDNDEITNGDEFVISKGIGHSMIDADDDGVNDDDERRLWSSPAEDGDYSSIEEIEKEATRRIQHICTSTFSQPTCYDELLMSRPELKPIHYIKLQEAGGPVAANEIKTQPCCTSNFAYSPTGISFLQPSINDGNHLSVAMIPGGKGQVTGPAYSSNQFAQYNPRNTTQNTWIKTPSSLGSSGGSTVASAGELKVLSDGSLKVTMHCRLCAIGGGMPLYLDIVSIKRLVPNAIQMLTYTIDQTSTTLTVRIYVNAEAWVSLDVDQYTGRISGATRTTFPANFRSDHTLSYSLSGDGFNFSNFSTHNRALTPIQVKALLMSTQVYR